MTSRRKQKYIITNDQIDTIWDMFSQPEHSMDDEDYEARKNIIAAIKSCPYTKQDNVTEVDVFVAWVNTKISDGYNLYRLATIYHADNEKIKSDKEVIGSLKNLKSIRKQQESEK